MAMFVNLDLNIIRSRLEKAGYKLHHIAYAGGFIKKGVANLVDYNGHFGKGKCLEYHKKNNVKDHYGNLHIVEYWLKEVKKDAGR